MSTRRILLLLLAMAAIAACRPDDQRTDTVNPAEAAQQRENYPPEVVAHLDSGSVAFREDDHERALAHYQRAAEVGPEIAAAWFGVYMAHRAMGNADSAAAALARAQGAAPGASLIHPAEADTMR